MSELCWHTGEVPEGIRPDDPGMQKYTALIRAPEDPERLPRSAGPNGRQADQRPHLTLRKTPAEEWARRILEHLQDGEPRTLNRIGVEMLDKTADITWSTPFAEGLWSLVESGQVEHTCRAPIRFRARS